MNEIELVDKWPYLKCYYVWIALIIIALIGLYGLQFFLTISSETVGFEKLGDFACDAVFETLKVAFVKADYVSDMTKAFYGMWYLNTNCIKKKQTKHKSCWTNCTLVCLFVPLYMLFCCLNMTDQSHKRQNYLM